MSGGHRRAPACGIVLVALLTVQACDVSLRSQQDPTQGATSDAAPAVLFSFSHVSSASVRTVVNQGRLGGRATTMAVDGGRVVPTTGPRGTALRFPGADSSARHRRAILVYTSDDDGLDPGDGDLRLGADFKLDRVSQAGDDNGNNIVQRGLSRDPTQYKLQAEDGFASCRIAGDLGELTVKSTTRIKPGMWYHVTCARSGDEVSLSLQTLERGAPVDREYRMGAIGSLTCKPSVPLVIGGKLTPDGDVVRRNSDQFNGVLDNVFVDIG